MVTERRTTIDSISRAYHIPEEDDETVVLTVTTGDLHIFHNALSLYCLWLRERGTLPLEYDDVSPEQEKVLERLKELKISPKQIAVELKAGALSHATHLRDLVEEEIGI